MQLRRMQLRDINISEKIGNPLFVALVIHFVLWLPAFLTLQAVDVPRPVVPLHVQPNLTPLGYTVSLSLWLVPAVSVVGFVLLHRASAFPWKSLGVTVAVLLSLGVILDVAFGNLFFTFPNAGAHLGLYAPGWDWNTMRFTMSIPIEEFFFYLFGDAVALLIYLWCDRFWLNLYSRNEDPYPYAKLGRLVSFAWWPVLLGAVIFGTGWAYKAFFSGTKGFPGYFLFLIAVAFVPATLFFTKVHHRINWQAYGCTALTMFFISLIWECTIAFPYGWWAYKPEMMLGMDIRAWSELPVEEPFLWLLVTFSSIMTFEVIHAAMSSGERVGTAVLGEVLRQKV